ncbi:hypothetical protein [Streptomyces hirsutus]|uniref:hypothetical protein n=1 Tax=Streptomyces hirsutus TaxID=35620 RepID=UPI0006E3C992|nr:hypothetical protein [Streptomyces hirsutus]
MSEATAPHDREPHQLLFGAVLLGPALPTLENVSWRIVGYAVLSLTVLRMLPVAVALAGRGL